MVKKQDLWKKGILFLISLVGLFLFSCENSFNLNEDKNLQKEKVNLKITTNLSNSQARTVLPKDSFTETSPGLTWTLKGKKQGNNEETLGTWNDTKDQTGAVTSTALSNMQAATISVEVGAWDFTLTVKNEGGKVLEGELPNQSISSTNATLSFIMKAPVAGTDVATGGINFTLSFPQDVVSKVEACLYQKNEDGFSNNASVSKVFTPQNSATTIENVTYTKTDVSAGYYMLQLDLYQQDPVVATFEKLEHINTYTTLVRVAPGLCSTGEDFLDSLAQLYNITYHLNDGRLPENFTPTSYNAYTTFALPTPIKDGCDFTGWYENAQLSSSSLAAGSAYSISEDTTLYAGWKVTTNNGETPGGGTSGDNTIEIPNDSGDLQFDQNNQKLTIKSGNGLNYVRYLINGEKSLKFIEPYGQNSSPIEISQTNALSLAYELNTDITVSNWIPIGKEEVTSFFKFDGQGHTITIESFDASVTNYAALFGYVGNQTSNGVTISNLVVAGPKDNDGQDVALETSAQYAGGIVAYSYGATITNCVNKLSINSNSSANSYVGGIVGYAAKPTTITSCVNFAELQASSDGTNPTCVVGGIIGQAYCTNTDNGDFSVNKCINVGNIYSNETNAFVSGIFGYSDIAGNTKIEDCINLGTVGWKESAQSLNASGIATIYSGTPTINRCINTELVKSSSTRFAIANIGSNIIGAGSFNSLYYDSTKWNYTDIITGNEASYTPSENPSIIVVEGKSTSDLCNLTTNELSEYWSFASEEETRYPLPELSDYINENDWNLLKQLARPTIKT